jgi:hypothetical protein
VWQELQLLKEMAKRKESIVMRRRIKLHLTAMSLRGVKRRGNLVANA